MNGLTCFRILNGVYTAAHNPSIFNFAKPFELVCCRTWLLGPSSENIKCNCTMANLTKIKYGRYYVGMYVQQAERKYNLLIGWVVEQICYLYFDETESFSQIKIGKRCELNNTNLRCCLTEKGGSTAYGNIIISNRCARLYKWTFKIVRKKVHMFIGIDSNPKFMHCDFSNYYRSFSTNPNDVFCAYGSDGNIYDSVSMIAKDYGIAWKRGDTVQMIVDTKNETLSYCVNDKEQGIALNGMQLDTKSYRMAIALFYLDDAIEIMDFDAEYDHEYNTDNDTDSEGTEGDDVLVELFECRNESCYIWNRTWVIVCGLLMVLSDEQPVEVDMTLGAMIIDVVPKNDERQFVVCVKERSTEDNKRYLFKTASSSVRNHWVNSIRSMLSGH
eukprot:109023_1